MSSHDAASVVSGNSGNKSLLCRNQQEQTVDKQRIVYDSLKFEGILKIVRVNKQLLTAVGGERRYVAGLLKKWNK